MNPGILTSLAIWGLLSVPAIAQIDVNETGLHEEAVVCGLQTAAAPDPNVNTLAVTLFAWGYDAEEIYANSSFYAYGIHSDVNLVNSGAIRVQATGGIHGNETGNAGVCFTTYGIHGSEGVDNTGDITIAATEGLAIAVGEADAHVTAWGLYCAGGDANNTGNIAIDVSAGTAAACGDDIANAYAYAEAYGTSSPSGSVHNTGDFTITARGGEATADSNSIDHTWTEAGALAYGIDSDGGVDNRGDFLVAAWGGVSDARGPNGMAYAIARARAYGAVAASGDLDNAGRIAVTAVGGEALADSNDGPYARAEAYGYGLRAFEGAVNNTGDITVSAMGGAAQAVSEGEHSRAAASATAYGIQAGGRVENTGTVMAIGGGGEVDALEMNVRAVAYGVDAEGDVDNAGRIMAIAVSGDLDSNGLTEASATAYGIHTWAGANNTGQIVVAALSEGGEPNDSVNTSAAAYGIYAAGNVSNAGEIIALAPQGIGAAAYGIYMAADGNLSNTGPIRALADTAYELYVASGTTTLVDAYRITLDGDPCDASLFVADGATLALNDATLVVASFEQETVWNTPYRIFAIDSNGVVNGSFAGVQNINPDVSAVYDTRETADPVDDTVALNYAPAGSESLESVQVQRQIVSQATDAVDHQMTSLLLQNVLSLGSSPLLADAGSTQESLVLGRSAAKASGVFVEPYYSRLDKDAKPVGYDADVLGFSAGYEQFVNDSLLGLHFGYGRSNVDYTGAGYSSNGEDQHVVTAGAAGLTRWDPWLLRYGLTGFYGFHDYRGQTGLSLDERETASYHSYGASATLMGGRIFRRGSHVLLPEAGLEWLWSHREQYETQAEDPTWDTAHSSTNDHDLQARAALRWLGDFTRGDVRISPSAAVGIRHLLTDAETGAWQSVNDAAPVLVTSQSDRTALTLAGSLTVARSKHALSLAYDGEYSPDAQRHNLWLRCGWLF